MHDFLDETGWRPDRTFLVAGALAYSRYGFLKRRVMRWISRREGGDTDTSRDYEYTDRDGLRGDGEDYLRVLARVPADAAPSAPLPARGARRGAGGLESRPGHLHASPRRRSGRGARARGRDARGGGGGPTR